MGGSGDGSGGVDIATADELRCRRDTEKDEDDDATVATALVIRSTKSMVRGCQDGGSDDDDDVLLTIERDTET